MHISLWIAVAAIIVGLVILVGSCIYLMVRTIRNMNQWGHTLHNRTTCVWNDLLDIRDRVNMVQFTTINERLEQIEDKLETVIGTEWQKFLNDRLNQIWEGQDRIFDHLVNKP